MNIQSIDTNTPVPYWIRSVISEQILGNKLRGEFVAHPTLGYRAIDSVTEPWGDAAPGFMPFTASQRAELDSNMPLIGKLINVQVVKITSPVDFQTAFQNNIRLFLNADIGYAGIGPGNAIILNRDNVPEAGTKFAEWDYGYGRTVFHELLHTLGLMHPFGTTSNGAQALPEREQFRSTMSYTGLSYADPAEGRVQTMNSGFHNPLGIDIAALQFLYGPSQHTRPLNDVYKVGLPPKMVMQLATLADMEYFDSLPRTEKFYAPGTLDEYGYDLSLGVVTRDLSSVDASRFVTLPTQDQNFVWDGGGIDTIDASDGPAGAVIYLTPGKHGYIGQKGLIGDPYQVTVNYGTDIENLTGTRFDDYLEGNALANHIKGGEGSDVLAGLGGNDVLDGQSGLDLALYAGKRANYTVTTAPGGEWSVQAKTGSADAADGRDTLRSIERIKFSDTAIALDMTGQGHGATTAKILGSVFGKVAVSDKAYAGIGLHLLDAGVGYEALLDAALDVRLGANASDTEVVHLLWTNIVGRGPTTAEASPFINALGNGTFTQSQLGVAAAELAENAASIGLVGLAQTGLEYTLIA